LVLGHLSLAETRKSIGRVPGLGFAMAELALESMRLATIPFLIIAAIAIPSLLRARVAAKESAAVHGILNTAEITYPVTYPASGYTCSLSDLSDPIGPEYLAGRDGGYVFPLTGCALDPPGSHSTKRGVACPQTFNPTGGRALCCDESGLPKHDARGSAQACFERGDIVE
jgi:type IV pilus assembly protein PilA